MKYKIEKDIPIPKEKRAKYPFGSLEVGQSVIIDKEHTRDKQMKYNAAANNYGKKWGKKFVTRKTEDGYIRVWRVE